MRARSAACPDRAAETVTCLCRDSDERTRSVRGQLGQVPRLGAVAAKGELAVGLLDHDRVVRRAHDRRAALAREPREEQRDGERVRLVEARRRLVGEEHLRPRRERTRDRDPHLLAGREAPDPLLGPLREPDGRERLDRERRRVRRRDSAQREAELDVLAGAERLDEPRLLADEADVRSPERGAPRAVQAC